MFISFHKYKLHIDMNPKLAPISTVRLNHRYLNLPAFRFRSEWVNRTQPMRFHPFTFTGKERDEETGYGYFGARYMDHELMTMWLSVDPMADKYPSISPYAYCVWNPVKLVDPNGKEWDPSSLEIVNEYKEDLTKRLNETSSNSRNEIQTALEELDVLTMSNQMYCIGVGEVSTPRARGETGWDYDNKRVCITLSEDYSLAEIGHELKHAYQFEIGEISFGKVKGQPDILYDFFDERAAYDRGAALGGAAVSDIQLKYNYYRTYKDAEGGYYNCYLFLTQDEVNKWHSNKTRDFGQNRTQNLNSNNYNHLSTQIYRKDGVTHGI